MPKLLIPLLAAVVIGGGAAGGGLYLATRGETLEEVPRTAGEVEPLPSAAPTPSPTAPVKGQLWRWVNVTVVIPEGSDVLVMSSGLADGGLGVELRRDTDPNDNTWSWVSIDAETGVIVRDEVFADDRAAVDDVLQSLVVAPLDLSTAPWPYNGDPPAQLARESYGGISFLRPLPATGLQVYGGIGDPCCPFIGITNGRSSVTFSTDLGTGPLSFDFAHVVPEDREVFERWTSQVKVCGVEVQC